MSVVSYSVCMLNTTTKEEPAMTTASAQTVQTILKSKLSGVSLRLYLVLASKAVDGKVQGVGYQRLFSHADSSSILRSVPRLEEAGLIEVKRGGRGRGRTHVYTVNGLTSAPRGTGTTAHISDEALEILASTKFSGSAVKVYLFLASRSVGAVVKGYSNPEIEAACGLSTSSRYLSALVRAGLISRKHGGSAAPTTFSILHDPDYVAPPLTPREIYLEQKSSNKV